MGLNKMLKQGLESENKVMNNITNKVSDVASKNNLSTEKATKPDVVTDKKSITKKSTTKKIDNISEKNKGGRPTNQEKGISNRHQHTLTLKDDDYQKFLMYANSHELSFAKFLERAAKEYIVNHPD